MSVISTHNEDAGFFSCCAVKLLDITTYINKNNKFPDYVDSLNQFNMYKKHKTEDITYDYFEHYNNIKDINIVPLTYHYRRIKYHWKHQYIDYSKLDYNHIIPVVTKFFSPSTQIINKVEILKHKYNIDYDNTIAVYYRATDKHDTQIASYETFYNKIVEIIKIIDYDTNEKQQIIIQTDTSQFVDYINSKHLENVIIFNENSTSYSNRGIHNEKTYEQNGIDMFNLFPIFLILSKCKYFICGSGNVSIWIMYYRDNINHVYQFLNGIWYGNKINY